jgi:hypothetical protein
VHHPVFEAAVVAAIVTNCVLLAMDNHGVREGSALQRVTTIADRAFAAFFLGEMALKLVALGGWSAGPWYVSINQSGGVGKPSSSRLARHSRRWIFVARALSMSATAWSIEGSVLAPACPPRNPQVLLSRALELPGRGGGGRICAGGVPSWRRCPASPACSEAPTPAGPLKANAGARPIFPLPTHTHSRTHTHVQHSHKSTHSHTYSNSADHFTIACPPSCPTHTCIHRTPAHTHPRWWCHPLPGRCLAS